MSLVQGEALAAPVAGSAQPPQLAHDRAAGFLFPAPDFFEEFFAPHLRAAQSAFCKRARHNALRGDARMSRAGLQEDILAAHALETGERILRSVVKDLPELKAP